VSCNNGKKISQIDYIRYDVGVKVKCEAIPNGSYVFSSWYSAPHSNSTNSISPTTTFKLFNYVNLKANFTSTSTFLQNYGNTISIISLTTLLLLPALFSVYPLASGKGNKLFIVTRKIPKLKQLDHSVTIQIDGAVIAGTLVLLTLTTTSNGGINRSQITFIAADIIFPFAISAIVAVLRINEHGTFHGLETRLMIAGFVNLMVSIILMAIIGY
jgi:hypothetical protein